MKVEVDVETAIAHGDAIQHAHAAILRFCNSEPELVSGNAEAREALGALIAIANKVRPKTKKCDNQNEDYPELRCRKKRDHKGRHDDGRGASWP